MLLLDGIEVNNLTDGTLADRAEIRRLIIPHSAVRCWTVDTLQAIASPFIHTDLTTAVLLSLKVLPFGLIVNKSRNIGFPRLNVHRIHRWGVTLVGILVGQSRKAMSELMDNNGSEPLIVSRRDGVEIEDTAATIDWRVDQDNDIVVRRPGKSIVNVAKMKSCEVTIRVERVEMRAEEGIEPQSFARAAYSTFL